MMKCVIMKTGGALEEEKRKIPKCGRGEVQVQMMCTGVCRTDLLIAEEGTIPGFGRPKKDLVPGHEGAGHVMSVGEGAGDEFKVGDMVVVPWLAGTCGKCVQCQSGRENLCPKRIVMGFDVNGTYAEYVVAKASHVVKIPDNLEPEQAAPISGAGLTAYRALKESNVKPGQFIIIFGASGGLGHMACQYALAMGMKVIGVDVGRDKLAFAESFGVQHTLDGSSKTFAQELRVILEKHEGVDVVHALVVAPAEAAYQKAVHSVSRGGTIVCVALPPKNTPVPIHVGDLITNGVSLKGSMGGTRQDLKEALQFAADGKVRCHITKRLISDMKQVHKALKDNTYSGRAVCFCNTAGSEGAPRVDDLYEKGIAA